jgi:hypothetical protein
MEDLAGFFAAEVRRRYGLRARAREPAWEAVAAQLGVTVIRDRRFLGPGYYLGSPVLEVIFLQPHLPPRVLCHEIFHALLTARDGLPGPQCYRPYCLRPTCPVEAAAQAFERQFYGRLTRRERPRLEKLVGDRVAGQRRLPYPAE